MKNSPVVVTDEKEINTPFVQVEYSPEDADTFFKETALSLDDALDSTIDLGD